MANHLKFCGCRRCRAGMHTRYGGRLLRMMVRKFRRSAKHTLRKGEEPPPVRSAGYTD